MWYVRPHTDAPRTCLKEALPFLFNLSRFQQHARGKSELYLPGSSQRIAPMVSTLPLLVFFAETCVVTLSTVRTIFVARGWKSLAPLLGFFEVSIWLFAITQVMQNLTNLSCSIAFAGGFSLGNFLGIF